MKLRIIWDVLFGHNYLFYKNVYLNKSIGYKLLIEGSIITEGDDGYVTNCVVITEAKNGIQCGKNSMVTNCIVQGVPGIGFVMDFARSHRLLVK